jgi:pyrroloquinoline quinone (PQQ) biosynthesis protein C
MVPRFQVESLLTRHVSELEAFEGFKALESGRASREEYERFLVNVVRTHLRSPQVLAFLYALAPPEAAENLAHNMLEEMGIEEESGVAHPSLLRNLATGAGLGDRLPELELAAQESLRQAICEPILYGTLREVGLASLVEVVAFEFMLSRVASRISQALARALGLSAQTLEWFTHHSEVDIRHAEQGIDNVLSYIRYYGFSDEDALTICDMALRENVFIKRYFGERALARTGESTA